jgi:hypothetical protein
MKLILTTSALLLATGDCGISRDQPCESGIKRDLCEAVFPHSISH